MSGDAFPAAWVEAAARDRDPLAFAEPGSVPPRGMEMASPERMAHMMALRRKTAIHNARKTLAALRAIGALRTPGTVEVSAGQAFMLYLSALSNQAHAETGARSLRALADELALLLPPPPPEGGGFTDTAGSTPSPDEPAAPATRGAP